MTATSFYHLDCICGQRLRSKTRDLSCPACGRQIHIEWPAAADEDASEQKARETKITAA